jgi:sugar transferase EpsL
VKRLGDIVVALGLLGLLSPVLALLALLAWASTGRPLFIQERPGLHGRLFPMLKFRTMRDGLDASGAPLPDEVRLTGAGRFMRRYSLDELPELANVLFGQMSLVGPRPLLPRYLTLYTPEQARRHEVRPGMTGWAQVHGRNALGWEERFALDVWYVDNRSVALDLRVLLMTVGTVIRGDGVNAPGEATVAPYRGTSGGSSAQRDTTMGGSG